MCRLRRPIKYVRFANTLLITYYLLPITSNFFSEKILVGQSGLGYLVDYTPLRSVKP